MRCKMMQNAKEWGVNLGDPSAGAPVPVSINMTQVQARKDRVVTGLTKGVEFLFKKNKIEWIKGTARLTGNGGVDVFEGDVRTLRARKEIIVATGSAPRGVPGIEIDRTRIITSDEAIQLKQVPKSLAVMGSGAVGVEFASIYRRFGSEVTILELLPRLVPVEDAAVSAELEKSFRKQGITSYTGARVTSARNVGDHVEVVAQLADGREQRLSVEYLLVATGRGPVTTGLDIERLGLEMQRGYIKVDAMYRTSVPGISAIGDVITLGSAPHPQLAHVSSAEGIVAAERIAGHETRPINYDHVPGCTYCDPEIGSVGLTEAEAQARGYDVRVGTFPFGVLGRAKMAMETDGFVKIVADKKYDEVLGVHMIGPRSTELVAEATLALRLESTVEESHSHHSRPPDDGRSGGRGGARHPRGGDTLMMNNLVTWSIGWIMSLILDEPRSIDDRIIDQMTR